MEAPCSVTSCDKQAVARGWCPKHWWRWRHHGTTDIRSSYDLSPGERFWEKVDKSGECWVWTSATDRDGYGVFTLHGNQVRAHRYSYADAHHLIAVPPELFVMHSCDNPPCVNPAHLSLGTARENGSDAARKGRRLPGSQNPQAKLTEGKVRAMRMRYAAGGITQKKLAAEYGVSHALVSFIVTRKAWRHI